MSAINLDNFLTITSVLHMLIDSSTLVSDCLNQVKRYQSVTFTSIYCEDVILLHLLKKSVPRDLFIQHVNFVYQPGKNYMKLV